MRTVYDEPARGCGFRKKGGIYLVSDGLAAPCGRLPIPLDVCPCCGAGIKPTRGWTWIQPRMIIEKTEPPACSGDYCTECPVGGDIPERAGLLWIGEKFYATVEQFEIEAARLGVSRRIHLNGQQDMALEVLHGDE